MGNHTSGFFLDPVFDNVLKSFRGMWSKAFEPEKVIFNPPATIVFWSDGTKTVVKASNGDIFNEETGLAMALAKKVYGRCHFQKIVKNADRCTAKPPKSKLYRVVYEFDASTVNERAKPWREIFVAHPLVATCEETAIHDAHGLVNMRMDCIVKLAKPDDVVKIGADCIGNALTFRYDILEEY